MDTIDTKNLITITKAAAELRLSRGSIYDAIERGELTVTDIAGRKFLSKTQVASYVPRPYVGKRENQRAPGQRGPSRWHKVKAAQEQPK